LFHQGGWRYRRQNTKIKNYNEKSFPIYVALEIQELKRVKI
jgi:hypothetical protein